MAYLDDIIIFSKHKAEHNKHIKIIFQKLKAARHKLKEPKCDFLQMSCDYYLQYYYLQISWQNTAIAWEIG